MYERNDKDFKIDIWCHM